MKKIDLLTITLILYIISFSNISAQMLPGPFIPKAINGHQHDIDTRVDNMGYWMKMARLGYIEVTTEIPVPKPVFLSPFIDALHIVTKDSPDIMVDGDEFTQKDKEAAKILITDSGDSAVTSVASTQSENSIFVKPTNNQYILNSNNSTSASITLYGTDGLLSTNSGNTWGGSIYGTGGTNYGDPAAAINSAGRYFVGHINTADGQSVAYSTNQGSTWTDVLVANAPTGTNNLLDKNHLWVDNASGSSYNGRLYDAWTAFGGSADGQVQLSRSTNNGANWTTPVTLSSGLTSGFNHGVNLQTGPNGEVYAIWAVYDSWPGDESAIGFASSSNGGSSFSSATRIINNIRGIRNSGTNKNQRVNSFPSMAVDISGGSRNGWIYVVWTNIGTPGTNTGTNISVYMIRSTNGGSTWSSPIRVNQDSFTSGKEHYFPWISCDPETGVLSVIFYDDRNTSSTQCQTYCAVSYNGGTSWEDFRVSDVTFTPTPISGLATGYMGDYLGISSKGGKVYPCWTDNRTGSAMSYVSPYQTIPPNQPYITLKSMTINDSSGNSNGQADYGETISLSPRMSNIGFVNDTNIILTLSCSSQYITVSDSTASINNLSVNDSVLVTNAFTIQISDTVPNGNIILTITAHDSLHSWASTYNLFCHAPTLAYNSFTISDSSGNNNGRLDPGETANLNISIINLGTDQALNSSVQITTRDPFLVIDTLSRNYGNISVGASTSRSFGVHALGSTPNGHNDTIHVHITYSGGYIKDTNFAFSIGRVPALLIDLDPNHNSANVIQSKLQGWNVNSNLTTSIPSNLNNYASIFVCLGIYPNNHVLTSSEGTTLAAYMSNGGNMYMEGGDTWAYDTRVAVHSYFDIQGNADGSGDLGTILGQTNTLSQGMSFSYNGENAWIDRISPISPAVTLFTNQNPAYNCGVIHTGSNYKTIGVSFQFSGFTDGTYTKSQLMSHIIDFFGIRPPDVQTIALIPGWNLISTYIHPQIQAMDSLMSDITSHIVIVKDGLGDFYVPQVSINTLGNINYRYGYQIFASDSCFLSFIGQKINPQSDTIAISSGWNMFSYLRSSAMSVQSALTSISSSILIVKDGLGNFYVPSYNLNSIGNLQPGLGYQIFASSTGSLIYPANSSGRLALPEEITPKADKLIPRFSRTGNSATLLIKTSPNFDGSEIGILSGEGELIGSSKIQNGSAAINIWGDDNNTDYKDGAAESEKLSAEIYNPIDNTLKILQLNNIYDLIGKVSLPNLIYHNNGIIVADAINSDNSNYDLSVSPNPIDKNGLLTYQIPSDGLVNISLYGLNGVKIMEISNEMMQAGTYSYKLNTEELKDDAYYLVMKHDNHTITKLLIIAR